MQCNFLVIYFEQYIIFTYNIIHYCATTIVRMDLNVKFNVLLTVLPECWHVSPGFSVSPDSQMQTAPAVPTKHTPLHFVLLHGFGPVNKSRKIMYITESIKKQTM